MGDLIKILLEKNPNSFGLAAVLLLASLAPTLLIALFWAVTKIFKGFQNKDEQRDAGMAALNSSIHENTLAIVKLTTQMEYLHKSLESLPEIRKDLDGLGDKIRRIERDKPNGN